MSAPENTSKELSNLLKELRLTTIRSFLESHLDVAIRESYSYEQFLAELLMAEVEQRKYNRIQRLRKESKLPMEKMMQHFDRSRLPHSIQMQLHTLTDGSFIKRRENILAFGNPGSGKTHLLCAIGHEVIKAGHPVIFYTCDILVQQLLKEKAELNLPRFLKRLDKYEALIIDDIGYVQYSKEEMEVLFTLLAHRYERGSVLLTSNLPFSKWELIFKDPMTTAAAIDRLIHHCIILELNLSSYRLEISKEKQKKEDDA